MTGKPFVAHYESITRHLRQDLLAPKRTGVLYRDRFGRQRSDLWSSGRIGEIESAEVYDAVEGIVFSLNPATSTVLVLSRRADIANLWPYMVGDGRTISYFAPMLGESLGYIEVEGLQCERYRVESQDSSTEYWYAHELREVIFYKKTDETKEFSIRLFDIMRIEPDSALFTIPGDYELVSEFHPAQ